MTCARGIHSCCPEAPSIINVTVNKIELDGATTVWVNEVYTGAAVIDGVLTLGHTPYQAARVLLFLNSGAQVPPTNFRVAGNRLILNFPVQASDTLHVSSIKVGDNVSVMAGSDLPVGSSVGYGPTGAAPDGFLFLDGVTTVTAAGYPALHAWLGTNLGYTVEGVSSVTYTLKNLPTTYYDGTTLVLGRTIIKY